MIARLIERPRIKSAGQLARRVDRRFTCVLGHDLQRCGDFDINQPIAGITQQPVHWYPIWQVLAPHTEPDRAGIAGVQHGLFVVGQASGIKQIVFKFPDKCAVLQLCINAHQVGFELDGFVIGRIEPAAFVPLQQPHQAGQAGSGLHRILRGQLIHYHAAIPMM